MTYSKKGTSISPFVAKGFRESEFFRHHAVVIGKQYPDTLLSLEARGVPRAELLAGRFCQLNLYSDHVSGFPPELFTDRAVNWHNQQLGVKGLIAVAGLYVLGDSVVISFLQSDLCQQLYRHAELKRSCKTQVDKRFGYWYRILFHAILDFAMDCGVSRLYCPTASWILGATRKAIQPDLFRRVYDSPARHYCCHRVTLGSAEYWEVSLADNADRVVRLVPFAPPSPEAARTLICVFHDIEENVDTDIPAAACQKDLASMLKIEKDREVRSTYNVLGTLFQHKRDEIWSSNPGHSLGFHSFNHDLTDESQLERCRQVDLQVRGYRPPRSVITSELTDYRLSFLNFEWLASGERSIRSSCCALQNGIVKIPILTDDYPLVTGQADYRQWQDRLLESARQRRFLAFGLHDCYANVWLDFYGNLLDQLSAIGDFVTADETSDRVFWLQGADIEMTSPAPGLPVK